MLKIERGASVSLKYARQKGNKKIRRQFDKIDFKNVKEVSTKNPRKAQKSLGANTKEDWIARS